MRGSLFFMGLWERESESSMCQQNLGMFPFENVLEIILAFDGQGLITYDNAAAREKLG